MSKLVTPEMEGKAQLIANRYGGGAIPYYAALSGLVDANASETAEHILIWCESSQPHWKRLKEVSVPGNFIRPQGQAAAAFNLAVNVAGKMIEVHDLSHMELEASDILEAAKLFLAWKAEP